MDDVPLTDLVVLGIPSSRYLEVAIIDPLVWCDMFAHGFYKGFYNGLNLKYSFYDLMCRKCSTTCTIAPSANNKVFRCSPLETSFESNS